MPSHNTYSKATITKIRISLRTTGEAMKPKNRFQAGRLSSAFPLGLALLLVLGTELRPLARWLPPPLCLDLGLRPAFGILITPKESQNSKIKNQNHNSTCKNNSLYPSESTLKPFWNFAFCIPYLLLSNPAQGFAYLHNHRNDDRTTMHSFIEEPAQ